MANTKDPTVLVQKVRELLKKKGITQRELAARMKLTPSAVNQWMTGRSTLTLDRARELAVILGVPFLTLISEDQPGGEVHAFVPGEEEPPEGFVSIPEYKVTFAAGGTNGEPTWEDVHDAEEAWYRESFFKRHRIDASRCKRVRVVGDSMAPTLVSGDRVLIEEERDPSSVSIEDGAIYVINLDGDCRIKRLARIKDGIRVISDNAEKYPPEDYVGEDADRIRIYGRVYEVNRMM